MQIVLASGSAIRHHLLTSAGVPHDLDPAKIDEVAMRDALAEEGATPRDIADALAEAKARKVSGRHPKALVLGCDQTLDLEGTLLSKAETREEAEAQIAALSGRRHMLHSAIVAYEGHEPVWRHVGTVRLQVRPLSAGYITAYVARNWDSIRHSVGSYKLEEEGIRLFSAIEGDYFTVLGMPMLPLLSWLTVRGILAT
ncbi:Maf family protein [Palleronia abyssalis]|nr:Maf family protein [Palleronia abyssalis]